MFAHSIDKAAYSDPWKISVENRLASLGRKGRRVAYFSEKPDSSTFRYRVYNMIQSLNASSGDIVATFFSHEDAGYENQFVDLCDVLVVSRTRYCDRINRLITRAKGAGKKVFFDVDDLVFDADYAHLLMHTLKVDLTPQGFEFWFANISRIGACLKLCDAVIVTNEYLAALVRAFSNRETFIIPNYLNREQMAISRRIFEAKKASGFAGNGKIHLGYFSGSPSHDRDFAVISGSLIRLLEKDDRIVLRVAGYLELGEELKKHRSRIEFHPFQDFVNLQRLIGETELNLVPLQDNQFTNCKSELKYFEAAIVGTVTIASPTYTFKHSIRNGENGFLSNAHEWSEAIEGVIDRLPEYPAIAEAAFADAERRYAVERQTALIEGVLFGTTTLP